MTNSRDGMNPVTWLIYCIAASAAVVMTRNPLYLTIMLLILWADYKVFKNSTPSGGIWSGFLRMGLAFMCVSVIFNVLTAHYGRTVLFALPESLPVIGGDITAEAAVYGLGFGLVFLSMVLVFALFNTVVDLPSVLRLVPGFLRQAAVLLSITFNFIPQTLHAASEIREAQRMRGYTNTSRLRSVTGTPALFVPLVITGLEKSCTLAESMESRAYGSNSSSSTLRRPLMWTYRDILTVATTAVFVVSFIAIRIFNSPVFAYSPYPKLSAPGFDLLGGLIFLLLLTPVVINL